MKRKKLLVFTALFAAILLFLVLFLKKGPAESAAPVKVILDCDMGYMNDDTLSLSMLLKAEELGRVEILGITLAGGNNFIDAPYENYGEVQRGSADYTKDFLSSLQRTDIPCFRGTDLPTDMGKNRLQELDAFYRGLDYGKFNDGYGAIHFFTAVDADLLCDSSDAADFLTETVRSYPDEVVIFVIGPSMNIAKAVQQDADFAPHVKAVYYMGGALGEACMMENRSSELLEGIDGANVTLFAEYNVLFDPLAFSVCMTAGFPSQFILPGSCNVPIDETIAEAFIAQSRGSGISGLWADHFRRGIPEYPYWDPLTVYAFLCPDAVVRSATEYVSVNTDRLSPYFGRTDGYSAEEYALLSPEQQALCGQATVIYETEGFWDYTTALLCS